MRRRQPLSDDGRHNEYMVFHGGSILLFLVVAADFFFNVSEVTFVASIILAVVIGIVCAIVKYLTWGIALHRSSRYYRTFRRKACWRIAGGSLGRAALVLLWMLAFWGVFVALQGHSWLTNSVHLQAYASAGFLLLMVLYLILTHRRVMIVRIPGAILGTAVGLSLMVPSFAGGIALRALGVGGGIPVSMTLMPIAAGANKDMPAQTELGCLVLRSGSETVVAILDKPTPEACFLHWSDVTGRKAAQVPPRFSEVKAIPNSRIAQIRLFNQG